MAIAQFFYLNLILIVIKSDFQLVNPGIKARELAVIVELLLN